MGTSMLKHPIILALTCVGGFASDVDFSKVGAAIKSLNGTISSTERIELWQKIERIGIHDVSDFFPGLDRKETVETALHAIWSSGSHLDDARLKRLGKSRKMKKAGTTGSQWLGRFQLSWIMKTGFARRGRYSLTKDKTPAEIY